VQVNAGDSAADLSVRLTEVYQELEVRSSLNGVLYMHRILWVGGGGSFGELE
jgi:hypothetical protein